MSNRRTASVHLGANRVATRLTDCVSDHLKKVLLSVSTKVISRKEYVEHLRATIAATGSMGLLQSAIEPALKDQKALDGFQHIVISEHALLGPVEDMLTKKTMFPKAKRRVQNIGHAFSDRELSLHLAIAPQAECLTSLLADDDFSIGPLNGATPVHSWANLVARIRDACPRANVTVWNFEKPNEIMPSFLSSLLGIGNDLLDRRTRRDISNNACQQLKNAKLLTKIVQIDEELQTRMDVQYELDLSAIASMPNVLLARS